MKKQLKVAIIMPAYNESAVLGGVIRKLRKAMSKTPYDFIIVVVDDGSKDGTARQAQTAGAYVISHVLNTGTGGATATGLSYAQQEGYDIAATFDADGQHDPVDVIKGIKLIVNSDVDLLIGSRLIDSTGMSQVKILGNRGLSLVTYLIFGIGVTDSQSGMRIFSKKALDKLRWKTAGYEFCSEMLWRARQQKLKISEYPIRAIYTDYSISKGQNNWNAVNIIKSLVQRRIMEIFSE
jgi:glycosyltransferase involved in cell wall biosynthesis